jgi:pectinesterase
MGTLSSATVIVEGDDFIAENVIFKNSAPQVLYILAGLCLCGGGSG